MLQKKDKFTSKDFSNKKIFINSKKSYTQYGFFIIFNDEFDYAKKGIVISKKNFKTAVLRNKFKRLFYNTLLDLQKEDLGLGQKLKKISLIFYPRKTFTREELKIDLQKIVL